MLVIALDTSTPAVTAGLVGLDGDGARSLAERVTVNPRAHGELLTPQLLEVLAEAGHQLSEVAAIVVGSGPGPFTGLRVGMVTAAALGHASGAAVHPVCGLDAIAAEVDGDGPTAVLTDARRKEIYWAAYGAPDADGLRARVAEPQVGKPADVRERLAELGVPRAAGEMAGQHGQALGLEPGEPRYPTPRGLVRVAAADVLAGAEPRPLVPMYLRRPDAAEPGPRKPVTADRSAS